MDEKIKTKKLKKSIITLAIVCGVFIVIALTFYLLGLNTDISEFLTINFSRPISQILGKFISLFNFSVFELLCFIAAIGVLTILIFIIIYLAKKNKLKAVKLSMQLLAAIVGIVCIYTSIVTVSYNRKPVPIPQINNNEITESMVVDVYNKYMLEFENVASKLETNEKGESICPYTFEELSDLISEEYKRLDQDYFGSYTSKPKQIICSKFMSNLNILGITFTPIGEANVNKIAPITDVVPTIAHELAHTKGVMRENDANLIAYYLLITSDNNYLKYCGYLSTLGIMQKALIYANNKDKLLKIPNVASADYLEQKQFWDRYDSLNAIGDFLNNIYLKIQGESGTDSYQENNKGDYNDETQKYSNVTYTDVQRMIIKIFN